jgi:hypothetical protein
MARHGRGFPLGTQYLLTPLAFSPFRVRGSAVMALDSEGVVQVNPRVTGAALFEMTGFLLLGGGTAQARPAVAERLSGPLFVSDVGSGPLYQGEW